MPNAIAYGFIDLEDMFGRRVDDIAPGRINTAITESAAEWSRLAQEILEVFVVRTTVAEESYGMPTGGTLQPLDEYGIPKPVQGGQAYDVGYPIQGGGTAWGTTRVSQALMTVEEANNETLAAQTRDADWLFRHVLAALLDNASWVFKDKTRPRDPSVTVQPLANGDATVYAGPAGSTMTAHTHYLFMNAAISDANYPFDDLANTLREHPGNGQTVVVYIPKNVVTAVTVLSDFVGQGDPDVTIAAGTTLNRDGSEFLGPGQTVLGKLTGAQVWVVQWDLLPDNYLLAIAPDGDKPVAMREYPAASLQGLFPENHSPDGALSEYRMIRYAGFGVRNRVGAAVLLVGAGAYAVPAAYNAPLPV